MDIYVCVVNVGNITCLGYTSIFLSESLYLVIISFTSHASMDEVINADISIFHLDKSLSLPSVQIFSSIGTLRRSYRYSQVLVTSRYAQVSGMYTINGLKTWYKEKRSCII